jgi:acetoin utilization deacetylase AcuC-like enzyme
MNRTGLSYHPDCLKHTLMPGKPETPERVAATYEHFKTTGLLDELTLLTPEPATEEDLERAHTEELINYVRQTSEKGYEENTIINGDVYVGPETYNAAILAAGGVKLAAESVWNGEAKNAFALVRPPGHHASRNLPAGFCFFNNTAVAIEHLMASEGVGKVAVFDWDAHCGNGTMNIFYENPDVLTISIHQDPSNFYPGTGFVDQIGEGDGKGYCMNIPVPAGAGDADYIHAIDDFVTPKLRQFAPEMIFVAAGQDGHVGDGMSGLELTDDGYCAMSWRMLNLADELCSGKLVLTLEGGYNLSTLPETHHRIVSTLLEEGELPDISGKVRQSTKDILAQLREQLKDTPMADEEPGEPTEETLTEAP